MNHISVRDWSEVKTFIDSRGIHTLQFIETPTSYEILVIDGSFSLKYSMDKSPSDTTDLDDFEDNYKDKGNPTQQDVDSEGRVINRLAYGKKGWTYLGHPIEFTSSKLSSLYSKDFLGIDRPGITKKFYDSNGDELISPSQATLDSDCVETRVRINPPHDYEIISGNVHIHTKPTTDVRLYVIGGVIDSTTMLPWEYPTSSGVFHGKEFLGGLNFKYIDPIKNIETDGRASKFMCKNKGLPYDANQFLIIIKHDAGIQQEFQLVLEYFRA